MGSIVAILKEVTYEDLGKLDQLYKQLMDEPSDPVKQERVFKTIHEHPDYYLLGAYTNDDLVGTLMGIVCYDLLGECKPFMVIENVIVSSTARRQGIGRLLMEGIEQIARDRSCGYIILVSSDHRKEAHQMYAAHGYREDAVEGFRKQLNAIG